MPKEKVPDTIVTYGAVIKLPVEKLPELKSWLRAQEDVELIYQKTSVGRLKIVEEHEERK